MQIVLAFPENRGVDWWTERNAGSPVPGRWPYGLDRLEQGAPGAEVTAVEVPPLGRVTRLLAQRAGMARLTARSDPGRLALCWDESLAPAMVHSVRAERRFAGVIWATDRVSASPPSADVALIRQALLQLDGLWVLSRPQIDAVRSWLGPGCPPVHFLQFGVDPDFYRAAPCPDPGADDPLLVSIGGDRDRDPQTLFAALEQVRAQRPGLRCVVQSKSKLAAPPGVRLEEFIPHDQVRRLYAEASVVALATRPNLHGSGMTVALEAMSVGRPVVATQTPGMADYVVDSETGYLVPPGDSAALAERILGLLDDPAGAATMGERGRRRVLDQHTTTTMCDRLLEIIAG